MLHLEVRLKAEARSSVFLGPNFKYSILFSKHAMGTV